MNTDAILDFIVEFYIWFIIGGAIILFAIIGFIADKKKIFDKKKPKTHKKVEDNINDNSNALDNIDKIMYNDEPKIDLLDGEDSLAVSHNEELDNNISDNGNTYYQESIAGEALNEDNYDDYSENKNISFDESINNKNENDAINNRTDYINIDENIQDDLAYIDDLVVNKEAKDENQNVESAEIINDDIDEIDDLLQHNDNELNNHVSNDIEIINIKDDSHEDRKNLDEQIVNLNDKDDIPLNISYSQLKEIVEEIIAEQEQDGTSKQKDNIENYVGNIKPNLNQEAVENIKQLDEDEDDVWKF